MRRRSFAPRARWVRVAALWIAAALGAPAPAAACQTAPTGSPSPAGPSASVQLELPELPPVLPGYDEGLRRIVALTEEGRGDEALLWTLAYLDLRLPGSQAGSAVSPSGAQPDASSAPAPAERAALPELPPGPELTEAQRASLHYVLAVLLAGVPGTEAPADPAELELLEARETWALENFQLAEGLAGGGSVRADANFNRGALRTWRGERGFLTLLREVAAGGGGAAPFPEDSPEREALIAARGEFAAGRDAALDGLRLGWSRSAAGRAAADAVGRDDLRANLEFCQRRLRQIDRLLELPPEEEPPPEQQDQEDQESQDDSDDSQDSESGESEADPSEDGDSEGDDSEGDDSEGDDSEGDDSEDGESEDRDAEGDRDGEASPEDSNGEREDSDGDPDPESLEEREPRPAEPPSPEQAGAQGEDPSEADPSESSAGEQPEGGEAGETGGAAGQEEAEPPLSEEQVMQLLRRLADIEKDQERLRALIRGARRVPVEKDW